MDAGAILVLGDITASGPDRIGRIYKKSLYRE